MFSQIHKKIASCVLSSLLVLPTFTQYAIAAGAPMTSKNSKMLVLNVDMAFEGDMSTAFNTGCRDWNVVDVSSDPCYSGAAAGYKIKVGAGIAPSTYLAKKAFDSSGDVRTFEWVTQQFGVSRIPDETAAQLFRPPKPMKLNQLLEEYRFWKAYSNYYNETAPLPSCCTAAYDPEGWAPNCAGTDQCNANGYTSFLSTKTCGLWYQSNSCTYTPTIAASYISGEISQFMQEKDSRLSNLTNDSSSDAIRSQTEESLVQYVWGYHMVKEGAAFPLVGDVLRYMDVNGIESAWVDISQEFVAGRQLPHGDLVYESEQLVNPGKIKKVKASWLLSKNHIYSMGNLNGFKNGKNNSFLGASVSDISLANPAASTAVPKSIIEIFYMNGRDGNHSDLRYTWQRVFNPGAVTAIQSCDTNPLATINYTFTSPPQYDSNGILVSGSSSQTRTMNCADKSRNYPDPKTMTGTPIVGSSAGNESLIHAWPVTFGTRQDTMRRLASGLGLTPAPGTTGSAADVPTGKIYVLAYDPTTKQPMDLTTVLASATGTSWTPNPGGLPGNTGKHVARLDLADNPTNRKMYSELKTGRLWKTSGGSGSWTVASNLGAVDAIQKLTSPRQGTADDNKNAKESQYPQTFSPVTGPVPKYNVLPITPYSNGSQGVRQVECLLDKNLSAGNQDGSATTSSNNICAKGGMRDARSIMQFFNADVAYVHYVGRWEFLPESTSEMQRPQGDGEILQRFMKYNLCQSPYYDSVVRANWKMARPVYRYKVQKTNSGYFTTDGIALKDDLTEWKASESFAFVSGYANPYPVASGSGAQATFDDYGLLKVSGATTSATTVFPTALKPITYFKRWKIGRGADIENMVKGQALALDGKNYGFMVANPIAGSEEFDTTNPTLLDGLNSSSTSFVDFARAFSGSYTTESNAARLANGSNVVNPWNPTAFFTSGQSMSLLKGFNFPTSGSAAFLADGVSGPSAITMTGGANDTEEKKQVIFDCGSVNATVPNTYKQAVPTLSYSCLFVGDTPPPNPYQCSGAPIASSASTCSTFLSGGNGDGGKAYFHDGFISTILSASGGRMTWGGSVPTYSNEGTLAIGNIPGNAPDGGYYDGRDSGYPHWIGSVYIPDATLASVGSVNTNFGATNDKDGNVRYGSPGDDLHSCKISFVAKKYSSNPLVATEIMERYQPVGCVPTAANPSAIPPTAGDDCWRERSYVPKHWTISYTITPSMWDTPEPACSGAGQYWWEAPDVLNPECEEYCTDAGTKVCENRSSLWSLNNPKYLELPECTAFGSSNALTSGANQNWPLGLATTLAAGRCLSPDTKNLSGDDPRSAGWF